MTDCDFEYLMSQARDKEYDINLYISRHDVAEDVVESIRDILAKAIFASEAGIELQDKYN